MFLIIILFTILVLQTIVLLTEILIMSKKLKFKLTKKQKEKYYNYIYIVTDWIKSYNDDVGHQYHSANINEQYENAKKELMLLIEKI